QKPWFHKIGYMPFTMLYSKSLEFVANHLHQTVFVKAKTFWGDTMQINYPEKVSVAIHRYKLYEPELTWFLLNFLQKGHVFVDIGAHYGYFSLLASKRVDSNGS